MAADAFSFHITVLWLKPGVQIISRDRGGAFADGARQGAPHAQQIADRWHLLGNLSETMKGFFLNKQAQLKALGHSPPEALSEEEAKQLAPWQTSMRKHLEAKSLQLHQERVTRYKQIHDLHAKKVNPTTIARQVGVSRQCVYEYLRMQQPPERTRIHQSGQPMLEPYKAYLVQRWNEGCRNAQQAYREVKEQGYPGGDSNIVRFFGHLRKHFNQAGTFKEVDPATQTPIQVPPCKSRLSSRQDSVLKSGSNFDESYTQARPRQRFALGLLDPSFFRASLQPRAFLLSDLRSGILSHAGGKKNPARRTPHRDEANDR
jgi:hypothetical protein